jgi:hypothetical protein
MKKTIKLKYLKSTEKIFQNVVTLVNLIMLMECAKIVIIQKVEQRRLICAHTAKEFCMQKVSAKIVI